MSIQAVGCVIKCVCGNRVRVNFGDLVTCPCSATLEACKMDDGRIEPHARYKQFDTYAQAKRMLNLKYRKPKIDDWFYEDAAERTKRE